MIYRNARNHVSRGIRKFFLKKIPASEFVEDYVLVGVKSQDRGLRSLSRDIATFWSDWPGYWNDDELENAQQLKSVLEFLHSDNEVLQ